MPEKQEAALEKEADKLEAKGELHDRNAFVYGILRKTGWKPRREREAKSE